MPPYDGRHFPYMFWAHAESIRSPYCLSQSGMPAPDAGFLDGVWLADLAHPCAGAQPEFEARIAHLFGTEPERVVAVVGASSGMQLAAMRWFGAGSRVLVEVPSYEPMRELPAYCGAQVVTLERRAEEGWAVDLGRARAALATGSGPGHVFVTNPNNPTGARSDEETMRALAALAAESGGVLVSNEVYMEYAPNDRRVHAFSLAPNAVSIGSLTKAYGLGAIRVGWMILGEGLADERDSLFDLAYLGYVDPPSPSLRVALAALDHLELLVGHYRRYERECRPHLVRWLRETPGVVGEMPELGLSAFPRIVGVDDTVALTEHAAAAEGVDVVPGEFFGRAGHLRIGFGVPEATLEEGLVRLARAIETYPGSGA